MIKHLSETKERMLIAVAWFTNQNISNALIRLKDVNIDIIVDDNKVNRESIAIKNLQNNTIQISFIKDLQKNYYSMHNKFCVIDNKTVLTGSYNWSKNANTNDENLAFISDKDIATSYNMEFSKIKNKKYKIDRISFSKKEVEQLVSLIEKGLISLLKANRESLETGMFNEWTDKKIKNQIRGISERVHNTVKDKVGSIGIYSDLIAKYGIEFNYLATEEEKANSRHKYSKEGIDKIEHYLNIDFQLLKIKAIDKIVSKYQELVKTKTSREETRKILEMVNFIIKEKLFINNQLKNNLN
ncbi:phospholipase D-like domain-containing protein [Mariniflexile fucanivorans]|nr:phospholipase D-like domain-containing protein [Mariniflexile fucanivorans]